MTRLALALPHRPGEALHSFLGRNAARNRVDASTFCRHMGLDLVGVANGDPAEVDRLVDLTGADRSVLRHHALAKGAHRTWTVLGEVLEWHMLRRLDARACPLCLSADVASHQGPEEEAAYCRVEWLVDQIRTCPMQRVDLVSLNPVDARDGVMRWHAHDFAKRVMSPLPGSGLTRLAVRSTYVSGLEAYLCSRLRGERSGGWLDGMPFNAVALFTERVGVAALHGSRAKFRELGPDDWKAAGDAGWQVMRLGERGLADFVAALQRWETPLQDVGTGYQASFGSFWPFVLNASRRPDYDIPCKALTSQLGPIRPKLPSRLVNGGEDRSAKGYRLSTAAQEHRRRPETIRKLLSAHGVLGQGHEAVAAKRIVVEREVVAAVFHEMGRRMTLAEVARRLDVSAKQTGHLYRAGFLGDAPGEPRRGINVSVAPHAVDAFMDELTAGALERTGVREGEGTLNRAALSAVRPLTDVLRLIQARRLTFVGRLAGVRGLPSVVVRLDEVMGLLNGGDAPSRTFFKVSKLLRVPYQGVVALAADGHLETMEVRQRRNGETHDVVTAESLERFREEYVSVSCAALRWNMHPHAARSRLDARGIRSALPVASYLTPIYRIRDLPERPPSGAVGS